MVPLCKEVLTAFTGTSSPGTLNLRYLLSAINPADLNVIEGVYPLKPSPSSFPNLSSQVFVAGHEGFTEIKDVGSGVDGLQVGDCSIRGAQDPSDGWLERGQCCNYHVNPATAYNMLTEFVDLQPGSWVIQNGANGAGALTQNYQSRSRLSPLCAVPNAYTRPDIDVLKQELKSTGATHVLTYDELDDKKSLKAKLRAWSGGDTSKSISRIQIESEELSQVVTGLLETQTFEK
ncbi:hypothetical protein BV25DRAFT_1956180 [Artomyces pyxidatus]|uniref:Uncharacterized protein n=1 Tax=Artomyces pyxidatus TaxID=48021 RepID=A0ACB8SV08_9AGAM|nr:hypothetical protein BV25DRAFT_1956180 [Artomyces pyxidatus]